MKPDKKRRIPAHLKRMICIAGSPRSGTTWLGKTFDSHPATLYRHEPDSTHRPPNLPLHILPKDYDRYAAAALAYLQRMVTARDAKTSGILPVFQKDYYTPLKNRARHYSVVTAKGLSRAGVGLKIPDFIDHRNAATSRIVWKTIESLGRMGLLSSLLPEARFVHVVRHPCGHIASTLRGEARQKFDSGSGAADDHGIFRLLVETDALRNRGIGMAEIEAMAPGERLAVRWLAVNEQFMLETRTTPSVRSVAYEAICDDPVAGYRSLFEFCDLRWPAQTEGFLRKSTSRDDSGYYAIHKDPARAANKWRDELEPAEADRIRAVVADSLPWQLFAGRE